MPIGRVFLLNFAFFKRHIFEAKADSNIIEKTPETLSGDIPLDFQLLNDNLQFS